MLARLKQLSSNYLDGCCTMLEYRNQLIRLLAECDNENDPVINQLAKWFAGFDLPETSSELEADSLNYGKDE